MPACLSSGGVFLDKSLNHLESKMMNVKLLTKHTCPYCYSELKTLGGIQRHVLKCRKRPCNSAQTPSSNAPPKETEEIPRTPGHLPSFPTINNTIPIIPDITSEDNIIIDKTNILNLPSTQNIFPKRSTLSQTKSIGNLSYEQFYKIINKSYDEIVHFRRNLTCLLEIQESC